MLHQSTPRGIRNNNPGNIRKNPAFEWQGETGVDNAGFVKFDTAENGIRAIARVLSTYRTHYGLNTIAGILNRWAPPIENNTDSYINHAVRDVGVSADTPLSEQNYLALIDVIITHENGVNPYSMDEIQAGVAAA